METTIQGWGFGVNGHCYNGEANGKNMENEMETGILYAGESLGINISLNPKP